MHSTSSISVFLRNNTDNAIPGDARTSQATILSQNISALCPDTGLILALRPVNERRLYFVTTSLIGRVQAKNQLYDTLYIIDFEQFVMSVNLTNHYEIRLGQHLKSLSI